MIKIFIMNGPDKGKTFESEKETISIGRTSNNDIQIKESSISREHLRIYKRGEKFIIEDLNSMNGTFVKGKLITTKMEFPVEEGVPITIGKIIISIGKACPDDFFSFKILEGTRDELSDTAMVTAYKDRPMTTPKNLEFLFKVSNVLMQSLDINEILEKILDNIFELLQRIDKGVIILTDPDTGEITDTITRSVKKEDPKEKIYSQSIVKRVLEDGKSIIMLDTYGQENSDLSASMEMMRVRSVMCVPLISRSQIRGVLYVDTRNIPYGFREEDLSILITLSSPAAIAIENALLYNNLGEMVEARTKSLKKTERMLRASEARFKGMFDNMSSGVAVYEPVNGGSDFIIIDLNQANLNLDNLKRKDVLGKSVSEVFPHFRELGLLESFQKVLNSGKPDRKMVFMSKEDQIKSWRDYYVYRLPSKEIVAIFDDLTERKKAEEEQNILQEQLFASQKMETIGAFAGGIAHNFRNILQAISGNVEYIKLINNEKPELDELTTNINDSIERGVDLINNLLHFSREGKETELVNLDLAEIIQKDYEIIEKIYNKNIDLKLEIEENLFVKGDRSLLSQAFMNLFNNARDAMLEGGTLTIRAKKKQNRIQLTVSDTGQGMDKDTITKIFDPFFTLKDVGKGTGLGLSTTHGIIKRHKGKINVSSVFGKGSKFKVSLPFAMDVEAPVKESTKEIIPGNGEKILIVDDERDVLNVLADITTRLGYETIAVDKPVEAVDHYKHLSPDVVLMDRSMPVMDGATCIKSIMEIDPKAKIVIISGYEESGPDGINESLGEMIKGYIKKPCKAQDLSHVLSRVLKNQEA